MSRLIGVVGMPGAGKDTFCDYFSDVKNSVEILKFSDPLSEILRIFFDEVKREDQQWLVNNLRERFGKDILAKAIEKKVKSSESDYILLNGVRLWEDFEMVKRLGGEMVYIKTDAEKRWKRLKKRGEKKDDDVSFEKFLKLDNGRTEKNIREIGKGSDVTIENNGSLDEFKDKIVDIYE